MHFFKLSNAFNLYNVFKIYFTHFTYFKVHIVKTKYIVTKKTSCMHTCQTFFKLHIFFTMDGTTVPYLDIYPCIWPFFEFKSFGLIL